MDTKKSLKSLLLLITSAVVFFLWMGTSSANAQTDVNGGTLSESAQWTEAGSPYILKGTVYVDENDTLQIDPNTDVKFDGNYSLVVYGYLEADSVDFTSNGTTSRSAWGSVRIDRRNGINGLARITNSTFLYANQGGVHVKYGKAHLKNLEIMNSQYGLYIDEYADSVFVENLSVSNNNWAVRDNSLWAINTTGEHTITDNDHDAIFVYRSSIGGNSYRNDGYQLVDLGIPYYFDRDFSINSDATLTISDPITLKFNDRNNFEVFGKLVADASNYASPIQFTSWRNDNIGGDTNNDGTSTSPSVRDWYGIDFKSNSSSESLLDNIRVSFSGYSRYSSRLDSYDRGAITVQSNATPTIQNSEFQNSFVGVMLMGAGSDPILRNNTFGTSERYPLAMTLDADPVFENNEFSFQDNAIDAIGLMGTTISSAAELTRRDFTNVPNVTYALLNNDIIISQSGSLTIEKGVVIKFEDARIEVKGTLNAVGGAETDSSIVFTSLSDDNVGNPNDTNKNGNSSVPDDSDWEGIIFDTGSDNSVLDYVTTRYAGDVNDSYDFGGDLRYFSPHSMITIADASVTVKNSELSHTNIGITVLKDGTPTIQDNNIFNTLSTPLALSMSADPTLSNNEISNSGIRAIGLVSETVNFDGTIRQRTLGGFENITYIMLGSITIANGTTVSVDPGIVIKGQRRNDIFVDGSFIVVGDDTEGPVIFTSHRDDNTGNPFDTNNDGNGSAPEVGDWGTIVFNESSDDATTKLSKVDIRYASQGVVTRSASPTISDVNLYKIDNYGLGIEGNSAPAFSNVKIEGAERDPILMSVLANPTFSNIEFIDNGSNGVALREGVALGSSSYGNLNPGGKYYGSSRKAIGSDATLSSMDVAGFENIPFTIEDMLEVNELATFTIEPGVIVKGTQRSARITVNGAFVAVGQENSPIVFTSIKDDSQGGDTNNNGNNSTPDRGDWRYIEFNNSSLEQNNHLKHVVIRYAGNYSSNGAININDSYVLLENSLLEQISHIAVHVNGNSNPLIRNNQLVNVDDAPVGLHMFSDPQFEGNQISNVGKRALTVFDETWTQNDTIPKRTFAGYDNITYHMEGHFEIGSGTHIVIPEGVVFKGNTSSYSTSRIEVDGSIEIQGTADNPVIFTVTEDDMYGNPLDTYNNGDNSESIPSGRSIDDYWLKFNSGSNDTKSLVENTLMKYHEVGVSMDNASPTIRNTVITGGEYGVELLGDSAPVLENNEFKDLNLAPIISTILTEPSVASGNVISGTTMKAYAIMQETLVQDFTLKRKSFAGIDNITYYFDGDYTVGNGAVLTIEPGNVLKFDRYHGMTVEKGLLAEGKSDSLIVFTNMADDFYGGDTNADSTETTPEDYNSGWEGITFTNQSLAEFSKLDYTVVRYTSDNSSYAGILLESASPTITNSIIQDNYAGVKAEGASNPIINNNDIYDNEQYGVWNVDETFNIDATNNWWGDNSGPAHSTNPNGTGDAVSDAVVFDPWISNGSGNPTLGDVSLNGKLQAYDGSLILRQTVGLETFSTKQESVADVSGDGSLSAMDAAYVLQYVVGVIDAFPAQQNLKQASEAPLALYEVSEIELEMGKPEVDEFAKQVTVPVNMSNVQDLISFSLELSADWDAVSFESVSASVAGKELQTTGHQSDDGKLRISAASPQGALGMDGEMIRLTFNLKENADTFGTLSVNKFVANETDLSGLITSSEHEIMELPEDFALHQNYPNPFNPTTKIAFDLPQTENVSLSVYNSLGQHVATLVDGRMQAGKHTLNFNASKLSSGVYIYRLQAGNYQSTGKMLLIK